METAQLTGELPEDVLERIISKMPFPQLFKARLLSKTWRLKLSPISDQNYLTTKRLVTEFQKLVGEKSKNWDVFGPCQLTSDGHLWTHDLASDTRREILSLSSLPKDFLTTFTPQVEGPLCLFYDLSLESQRKEMYVANLLKQSWRQLPSRPEASRETVYWRKLVMEPSIEPSLSSYKVILLCGEETHQSRVQVYDSISRTWDSTEVVLSHGQPLICAGLPVYLNGVFYMVNRSLNRFNDNDLVVFDVEERTTEELHVFRSLNTTSLHSRDFTVNLVNHRESLVGVVIERAVDSCFECCRVLKIDLESRSFFEVGVATPESLGFSIMYYSDLYTVGSHGDCLHIPVNLSRKGSSLKLLVYNMCQDQWARYCTASVQKKHRLPFYSVDHSFRPGLNPFVPV